MVTTTSDTIARSDDITSRDPHAPRFRDPLAWAITGLSLLIGAVFVVTDLAYNNGHLLAPLDDTYIHLQYARQIGQGNFFQYNPGDPISTGASSFLYALLLGLAAVALHGTVLLTFAVAFGVLCMALAAGLVYRLGHILAGRAVGAWAGVLVAVSGPLQWGAASGMEVGLTALLALATLYAFAREQPRFRYTPVAAFLLVLVRPEGMILALALCLAMLWTVIARIRADGSGYVRATPRALWCLLPVLAVLGQYLFYWLATGSVRANGVTSKSFLYDQPVFYPGQVIDESAGKLRTAVNLLLGLNPPSAVGFMTGDFAFLGMLLVSLVGAVYLLVARPRWRPLITATLLGLVVIALSLSTMASALEHELRYWQPFLPIFIVLAVVGFAGLVRLVRDARVTRVGLHVLAAMALVFSLLPLPTWAARLGQDSAAIRDTDVSAADWINGHLPPQAVVGVKDVGAAAYFGDHHVVDMLGLATNGFARAANNGIGSLYEALRHLPAGQRPDYIAGYDSGPGPSMQPLQAAGLFGRKPLATFEQQALPQSDGFRMVPFDQLDIYRVHWHTARDADASPIPGQVRDHLNVADLASERAHDYQPRMALPGLQPTSVLQRQDDIIDSGRTITGGEEFVAHNLRPHQPFQLVLRVRNDARYRTPPMQLRVDGHTVAKKKLPDANGQWTTITFTVPAPEVTGPSERIAFQSPHPFLAPYPSYTSFGYWIVQ